MPRPPRIHFEGATCNVFRSRKRRETLSRSQADYAAFEGIMREAMKWLGVQLYNWNQMPNHFHFNVETPASASCITDTVTALFLR